MLRLSVIFEARDAAEYRRHTTREARYTAPMARLREVARHFPSPAPRYTNGTVCAADMFAPTDRF